MPIQSEDVKIKRSAVMADVPEGGGAMTGVDVIDGQSNNMFNDVSTGDRSTGDLALRKVFGVAHTDDTDVLLRPGFSVLMPPADPNVNVMVFKTGEWFDERADAVAHIENYLTKGPMSQARIQDVHYTGSLILRLYSTASAESFPSSGTTVVGRNPNGQEQYLQILKVDTYDQLVQIDENSLTKVYFADCTLRKPIGFDLLGAPIQKLPPSKSTTAMLYTTTPAAGAEFHGVKPLGAAASIGDRSVLVDGGIFLPLIPASTTEEPVIDRYPLIERPTLSQTSVSTLTLPGVSMALGPGTSIPLPTAVEPATLTMTHGSTAFTTNDGGEVLQGSTVVGTVDWAGRVVEMAGTAPSYGTATLVVSYKPATVTGATAYSMVEEVTLEGRTASGVKVLNPPPAPGTLTVSFLSNGRWYDLIDDGTGKLSGADSSYGTGNMSFVTGSLAYTMGALPDIGSMIVFTWGEADSARDAEIKPTRAWAVLPMDKQPEAGSVSVQWQVAGGATRTATLAEDGTVTGPAQMRLPQATAGGTYELYWSPDEMPTGLVSLSYDDASDGQTVVNNGGGSYTLNGGSAIKSGSVRFSMLATADGSSKVIRCYSAGGVVYASGLGAIGTINNTTGAMSITQTSLSMTSWVRERVTVARTPPTGGGTVVPRMYSSTYTRRVKQTTAISINAATVTDIRYVSAVEASAAQTASIQPEWLIDIDVPVGLSAVTNDTAFTWAGKVHFVRSGVVFRDWNSASGATNAVGAMTDDGTITMGIALPGGSSNAITWANLAMDRRGGLDVYDGVFRVPVAPLKLGQFQLQNGSVLGSADTGGYITGDFDGYVDFERGIVWWEVPDRETTGTPVRADQLTYNAVFLSYVPIDDALLGIPTARLPIDGRVPGYRPGGQVVIHNTLPTVLTNPLTQGFAYDLGRERIAAVDVRDANGTRVPATLYTLDRNIGELTVNTGADISAYTQPLTVHHRIEDELLTVEVDISGKIDLAAALTHDYPAGTSYVSSKCAEDDAYARVYGYEDRTTWQGSWQATKDATSQPTASYNHIDYPVTTTNRGAIAERWAIIFTSTTHVRVVGEHVGQVESSVPISAPIAPINPQTGQPYFTIPAEGWGGGWSTGNCLLIELAPGGTSAWFARTVLPGGTTVLDDSATIAYRTDVDQP